MPAARLPDVNNAIIRHRNMVIQSLQQGNHEALFGSLYSMNGLLPDESYPRGHDKEGEPRYRIIISDIEYAKISKPQTVVFCYHCDDEDKKPIQYDSLTFYDKLLDLTSQNILHEKYLKAWKCPHCKKPNYLRKTRKLDKIAETRNKEPYYLGVMPKPPAIQYGVGGRTHYKNKIKQWGTTFLAELEAKLAQYRDDNWKRGGDTQDDENEYTDHDAGEDDI